MGEGEDEDGVGGLEDDGMDPLEYCIYNKNECSELMMIVVVGDFRSE